MFPEAKVSSAFFYEAVIDETISLESLVLNVSFDCLRNLGLADEGEHVRNDFVVSA
jgi:hypothetical protein